MANAPQRHVARPRHLACTWGACGRTGHTQIDHWARRAHGSTVVGWVSGGGVGGAVGEMRSATACSATEPAVVHLGRTRSRSARAESTMDMQSVRQRQWARGAAAATVGLRGGCAPRRHLARRRLRRGDPVAGTGHARAKPPCVLVELQITPPRGPLRWIAGAVRSCRGGLLMASDGVPAPSKVRNVISCVLTFCQVSGSWTH